MEEGTRIKTEDFMRDPYNFKACCACRSINHPANKFCILCHLDNFESVNSDDITRMGTVLRMYGKDYEILV
jgi:hypothetical protein